MKERGRSVEAAPVLTMRHHHILIVLSLEAAVSACVAGQDTNPNATPALEAAAAEAADPMASFARMVGGEWKMAGAAGTDLAAGVGLYNTWYFGPGKHSLRVLTDGTGGDGNPWRAMRTVYWHPGRKQVRALELSTFAAGVAEGAIEFDGETAEAVMDMYQTGGRRKLKSRWTFDGPDKYHDELLETTSGPDGYFPLAAWNWFRIAPPATPRPLAVEGAMKPSEHLRAFGPLLDHTWEANGAWANGDAFRVQSAFEWVPLANGIYLRVLAPANGGEPTHLLDAYVFHHTGANALRCLALSSRGGVYEGDVTVLDGGGLQLDLKGYEGERVVPYVIRLDFEQGGTGRQRIWSGEGDERVLMLDVQHKPLEPKKD